MDVLADLVAALDALLVGAATSPWMPLALFAVCFLDGFFPPVPSEVVLLAAATVIWTTQPELIWSVVLIATVGAWLGDNIAYAIGRRLGPAPFGWMRRGRPARAIEWVQLELRRRPESILITGRFVPVARVLVSAAAGSARIPYRRYLPLSLTGAAAWASVSTTIAVLVGSLVSAQPLVATALAVTIGLLLGVVVDRAVAWNRTSAAQGRNE